MIVFDRIDQTACGCDDTALVAPLMPVRDALAAGLAIAPPPGETEEIALSLAGGRILARPVRARADMPRFDNSGMDGYALRAGDLGAGDAPSLPVRGLSVAGSGTAQLPAGSAMRIYTGAPIPDGADAVVMQEAVRRDGDVITLLKPPVPGENIRRRGADLRRDARVVEAGQRLDARTIAACAGAGAGSVSVWKRLRVALLLTGDELCPAGAALEGGAIWDVNTPMLRRLIGGEHAEIVAVRNVPDTLDDMVSALDDLAGAVDLIVTSGGVSVGDRDHVKPALQRLGAKIAVSGVAIKPGKPVTLSRLGRVMVVSLPGNPVSAFVTWQVFGAPIAARMAGLARFDTPRRHVRAHSALAHKPGRCEYRPATITGYGSDGLEVVRAGAATRSAHLIPLAGADGLLLIPAETERLNPGDLLEFLPFPA